MAMVIDMIIVVHINDDLPHLSVSRDGRLRHIERAYALLELSRRRPRHRMSCVLVFMIPSCAMCELSLDSCGIEARGADQVVMLESQVDDAQWTPLAFGPCGKPVVKLWRLLHVVAA